MNTAPVTRSRVNRRRQRRGATMVEFAIVIMVFITLVFGMLDLGLAVFRREILSQAARQGVRQAIVHGSYATELGALGPATISLKATAANATSNEIVEAVRVALAGSLDADDADVVVTWLDGGNDPKDRVRVTVSADYTYMMLFIFGNTTSTLTASSTMPIAH